MSIENSNDTIGNRTRGLPTCSAVPRPTARLHVRTKHGLAVDKRRLYGEIILTQETFALLGYYAALSGISLLTFRDNVSVPSSRFKKPSTTRCVITQKIAALMYFAAEPWNHVWGNYSLLHSVVPTKRIASKNSFLNRSFSQKEIWICESTIIWYVTPFSLGGEGIVATLSRSLHWNHGLSLGGDSVCYAS
jgi:hypothetical protein